jgi:hypothetical protein
MFDSTIQNTGKRVAKLGTIVRHGYGYNTDKRRIIAAEIKVQGPSTVHSPVQVKQKNKYSNKRET